MALARKVRGAGAGPTIDVQKLAEALRTPRSDPRTWISAATVGHFDEAGDFQTTPLVQPPGGGPMVPTAVYADGAGMVVDVRLEPEGEPITVGYSGIAVGSFGSILVPLRGGEDVLVCFPNGDRNSPDRAIVAIKSNVSRPIPTDWNNDRVLFDLNVPLEIRGPAIRLTSNNLTINNRAVRFAGSGI